MNFKVKDIENWEKFNEMHRCSIETESYLNILLFMQKQYGDTDIINNEHYQYYQQKYLESYLKLYDLKICLSHYLYSLGYHYSEDETYGWTMNFLRKEVSIVYDK